MNTEYSIKQNTEDKEYLSHVSEPEFTLTYSSL